MADKLKNRSKVLHKQIYKPGPFGGTLNTTACRRVHAGDDYNVADHDEQVSCKFCRKIMDRVSA